MLNDTAPPVDTIELLLREIHERLRRRAERPRPRRAGAAAVAALALAAFAGCAEPPPPAAARASRAEPDAAMAPDPAPDDPCADCADASVPPATVVYVDHDHACRNEPHDASEADPYCEIAPALPPVGAVTVQLAPSDVLYDAFFLDGAAPRDVTILGPDPTKVSIGAVDGDAIALSATQGNLVRLTASGVTLLGGKLGSAVSCAAKSAMGVVSLAGVRLRDSGFQGLVATGCDVSLVRSVVRGNALGGVLLVETTYALGYDFVDGNGSVGIDLAASSGSLAHLTVTANRGRAAGGLRCDAGNAIVDSILVGNDSDSAIGTDVEVDPRCLVDNSALGKNASRGLACTPWLVAPDDPHLSTSTASARTHNRGCAIDHAMSSDVDIDGQAPIGLGDLGADEAG